jgi:hypothetical protein
MYEFVVCMAQADSSYIFSFMCKFQIQSKCLWCETTDSGQII